jgi:hypothetical protein
MNAFPILFLLPPVIIIEKMFFMQKSKAFGKEYLRGSFALGIVYIGFALLCVLFLTDLKPILFGV